MVTFVLSNWVPLVGSPGVLLALGFLIWRVTSLERKMTSVQAENLLQAVRIRKLEAHNGLPHPEQLYQGSALKP